ncbi:MAG: alanine racemase [Pseudomonadota bacterium]|nr:alanine racemase [Pseudomonadota bacterium]
MSSDPVAHINLAALQHNFERVKQLAPNSKIMSAIKADAYGHGAIQVAQALHDSDAFAVARLSEGLILRAGGIQQPIVLLEGVSSVADLQAAAENDLSIVFHHPSQLQLIATVQLSKPLNFCWLMVETGMHRLGLSADEIDDALQILTASPNILGEIGLMSHFANSDLVGDARNQQQLDKLMECADQYGLKTSMANSAAIFSFAASHGDWVRPGLMLYGATPFTDKTAQDLDLKPVMQLTSELIAIQPLNVGDNVGYGGSWIAEKPGRIGIVSIGYGDGYSRHLSNVGSVLINNQRVPIVGRVSMDMIAIDLANLSDVTVGDAVIMWGSELLTVDDMATQANTISYELLCQLNERVKREYHHG